MLSATVGQMQRLGYVKGICMDSRMNMGKTTTFLGQLLQEEEKRNDGFWNTGAQTCAVH